MEQAIELHKIIVDRNGVSDPNTLRLVADLRDVSASLHQSMPVIGPWLESRMKALISEWLPDFRITSGQVFDPECPDLRSRSWDIIVYKENRAFTGLPPAASATDGPPVIPICWVVAVIDTKYYFDDPAAYAEKKAFNRMNDCSRSQLDFLGPTVMKCLFIANSARGRPQKVEQEGNQRGLETFVLGQQTADPVAMGTNRQTHWKLSVDEQGQDALNRFKERLIAAAVARLNSPDSHLA